MDAATVGSENEEVVKDQKKWPEPWEQLNGVEREDSRQAQLHEVGDIPLEVGDPNLHELLPYGLTVRHQKITIDQQEAEEAEGEKGDRDQVRRILSLDA